MIIIHDKQTDQYEAWTQLTDLCRAHDFSYHYLKRQKFPFKYKGIDFVKVGVKDVKII